MVLRVRKLDTNFDRVFGHETNDFYIDEPRAVATIVLTRLMLYFGEWFLNTTDGTKWFESVLGYGTAPTRDLEIQSRVLGSPNVTEISSYSSSFDGNTRAYAVAMTIETDFGPQAVGLVAQPETGQVFFTLDAPVLGRLA